MTAVKVPFLMAAADEEERGKMMNDRICALDLGSNSLRLLVAEADGRRIIPLRRELRETRLGQGLQPGGLLHPRARERTLQALDELAAIAASEQAVRGLLVATSAVREAADGGAFLEEAARRYPFPARVLTPREEALLGYQGARGALQLQHALVVDLGGRSTEISWRGKQAGERNGEGTEENGEEFFFCSLPLGAVRGSEAFWVGPGPGRLHKARLTRHVHHLLAKERTGGAGFSSGFPGDALELVGLGGTVTTLAALDLGLRVYLPERVHGHRLTRAAVARWLQQLENLTLEETQALLPFAPRRADIFPAGVATWLAVMDFFCRERCTVSEEGLLWGVLEQLAGRTPFPE